MQAENERLFISSIELDLEPGLGVSTGQGSDPKVMARLSEDGGKTWGNERQLSVGKIGEYQKRVQLHRCGAPRRGVIEVTFTDPVPVRVTNAYIQLSQTPKAARQRQQASA